MYSDLDLALALAPLYLRDDTRTWRESEDYTVRWFGMYIIRHQVRRSRAEYFRQYRANRTPLQKAMAAAYRRDYRARKSNRTINGK